MRALIHCHAASLNLVNSQMSSPPAAPTTHSHSVGFNLAAIAALVALVAIALAYAVDAAGRGVGVGAQLSLGVVGEPLQQRALEVGIVGPGGGVLLIPDGELVTPERLVVALDDGFPEAELEVAVEPRVERRTRDRIVIVREMFAALEHDGMTFCGAPSMM